MPLPFLLPLAAAAAPAIAKAGLGLYQMFQHVNRQDSTTPEDRELTQSARLRQAAQLPGLAQYQARLQQGQNAALQGAALGAGGANDYIAAAAASDRVRSNGEQGLVTQGQQYTDRATGQLNQVLAANAARARADTQRAEQANAQLKGAGLNNLSNALTEGSSVAAYGMTQGAGGAGATGDYGMGGTSVQAAPALLNSPYPAGDYYGPGNPYRRRSNMYGGFPTS